MTADVSLPVVTVTGTWPIPSGDTTVMDVLVGLLPIEISVVPNVTIELELNPAPVMVTELPPLALPSGGLIEVTTGI